MNDCDVTVLGAGPYGLAAGAHLSGIKGLDVRVFGEPMEFWRSNMPSGMNLRSERGASSISDPNRALRIDDFGAQRKDAVPAPIPLARFVDYGLWFQENALPSLDRRRIRRVEKDSPGFRITLESGERWHSRRVVIAAGIGPFAVRPAEFFGLPKTLVTHCSDRSDVSRFRGRRVMVIGAGQSALESAALIHEAGGIVEVLVREHRIRWHGGGALRSNVARLNGLKKLLYAPTGVGPAGISRIVAAPNSLKYFPRAVQNAIRARTLRATAAACLADRTRDITLSTGRHVVSARQNGDALSLRLNDGSVRRPDHVVLGTGYKVDVSRYSFLAPELIQLLRRTDGYPQLKRGLESSIPGLHFLGAPAAWTFGPLMNFVAGTEFAAKELARGIAAR